MNMQEFVLNWLVESGWQAGCMALCTFVLLAIFRGSIPPRWRHALWLLVACRLLLPALPSSPASAYRYIPPTPAVAWEQALPETPAPNLLPTTPTPAPPSSLHEPGPAPSQITKRQWERTEILFALWLAGVAVGLGWLLIKQVAFYRHFLRERTRPDAALQHLIKAAAQDCGLRQPPRAYLTSGTAGPSLFGFLAPTLLLPPDIQTRIEPARLRLVILHECMHLKRFDLWTHWISLAVAITHWWNPLAWWVIARIRIERELATDAAVLEVLRQDQQKEYGETLLTLAQSEDASTSRMQPSIGIFEKHADLKSRLRQTVSFVRSKPIWSFVGVLCLIAAIPFLLSRKNVKPTEKEPQKESEAVAQIETNNEAYEAGMALWSKVKEKYATCDSFYCEAEQTDASSSSKLFEEEKTFSIRFQRPDLLRVDWVEPPPKIFTPSILPFFNTVLKKAVDLHTGFRSSTSSFFTKDGRYFGLVRYKRKIEEFPSIDEGISAYAGVSGAATYFLPPLLLGKTGYFYATTAKIVGERKCYERDCYELEILTNSRKFILTVDKKSLAILSSERTMNISAEESKISNDKLKSDLGMITGYMISLLTPKNGFNFVTKTTYTTAVFDKKMAVEEFEYNDPKRPYALPPRTKISESERQVGKGVAFLDTNRQQKTLDTYRKAEKHFSEAIQSDTQNSEAWSRRCEARVGLRDYAGAIADAGEALKLKPNYWHSLMYRGQAYHALGQHDMALADYNAILKDNPDFFWPPELKAYCYMAMGRVDDAYKSFAESWDKDERPHIKHRMGIISLLNGNTDRAMQDFKELNGLWRKQNLCMTEYLSGNLSAAQKQMSGLCHNKPNWLDGTILFYALQVRSGASPQFPAMKGIEEPWKVCVAQLGRNEITLKEALEKVRHPEDELQTRVRQADCYLLAGYQALAKKSNKEALEMFTQSAKTGQMLSHTFILARAECKKLNPAMDINKLLPEPMLVSAP